MEHPFQEFGLFHLLFLVGFIFGIIILYRFYSQLNPKKQRTFQVVMGIGFIIEEFIYTCWVLINCHHNALQQVLPLELCSICVYMNAATVFFKNNYLKVFSGLVGLIAGSVAMLYPVNISGLYPVLSYRVINFYMLHASFVLFACIQLKDQSILAYCHMKKNYLILCCLFSSAFVVNLMLDTQYMFVGIPPKIGLIASLYQMTGIVFFLPMILVCIGIIQFIVFYLLRKVFRIQKVQS
ncbi:MAG: YwaF family protein [Longicatena sp.]